jgi:thiol:disulfide interchange protein DsbC
MNRFFKTLALAVAAVAFSSAALADAETDGVLAALKDKYPSTKFSSVEKAPVGGMYEVVMGKNIAYTDKDGRYFMFGSLYDMQSREDLTAPKRETLSRIDTNKLPLKDAFVRVKGSGVRKLYVFSDPDCRFCKQLEPELEKLDDVTIYTFIYPIVSLHGDAPRKSEAIWCTGDAKTRADVWRRVVSNGERIESKQCDNPIQRNVALGESLTIRGTPTLLAADGRQLPGAASKDRIEAWLNGGK